MLGSRPRSCATLEEAFLAMTQNPQASQLGKNSQNRS